MTRITKDWIEALFEYGIDKANRRIYLTGDVEDINISHVIKAIYLMESESKSEPIELFISSFGGALYDMLALYDVLYTIECPIHTVAVGKCMSAAVLLVAAGEKGNRYATANTSFMYHKSVDEPSEGDVDKLTKDIKHFKHLENLTNILLAKHTNKTATEWKKFCSRPGDQYFTTDDAIEWGIVDQEWNQKEGE